jgi:hypothetical protein
MSASGRGSRGLLSVFQYVLSRRSVRASFAGAAHAVVSSPLGRQALE